MKRLNNFSKIFLLVVFALSLATCKNNKFLNVNNNLNDPTSVVPSLALPTCQANIAYMLGNQMAIMGGMWGQYWTQDPANGIQYSNYDKYNNVPTDNDRMWTSMYAVGANLNYIINTDTGTRVYAGIAYLMKAYNFQLVCDAYGASPLSQALLGAANTAPAYDPEQQIYDSLVVWVYDGMAILNPAATAGISSPSSDLVFPGQPLSAWQKFGNTLLLRIYMRECLKAPSVSSAGITRLLASPGYAAAGFMATKADDAKTIYINSTFQQYPLYATYLSLNGFTQLIASATVINMMNGLNDPRIGDFFTPNSSNGVYEGLLEGNAENIQGAADTGWSRLGSEIFSPTASVFLLTATESQFLQAEAEVRGYITGGASAASASYTQGITVSFSEWTSSSAASVSTYTSQSGVSFAGATSSAAQINLILTQKWLAMCGNQNFEGWTEWRRTRIPTGFVPSASSVLLPVSTAFPRRFVYPSEELLNNTNFPGEALITAPIWWDIN